MKKYGLIITTAKEIEDDSLKNYNIAGVVKDFNDRSINARNPKQISSFKVNDKDIELTLTSNVELNNPLKALWLFSNLLFKEKSLDGREISRFQLNSKFLTATKIKNLNTEQRAEDLTDTEVLQKIVEIYLYQGPRDEVIEDAKAKMSKIVFDLKNTIK